MAQIRDFEDLNCWQKARVLTNECYRLVRRKPLSKDFRLRDQLTGAALSAMSNIAEGFARFHRRDFMRFLDIAQSSAIEVKSLLYVVLDQEYAPTEDVREIQSLCDDVYRTTLGLLRWIKRQLAEDGSTTGEPQILYQIQEDPAWSIPDKFTDPTPPQDSTPL